LQFWAPNFDQHTKAMVMDVRQAIETCSSIPLLGCVVGTLFHLFRSYDSTSASAAVTRDTALLRDEVNDPQAAASNRAAQKHFQQIQHVRGA
jgi:hypothetical protein